MSDEHNTQFINLYTVNETNTNERLDFNSITFTQEQACCQHWGQRKLLLNEIYFLSMYSKPGDTIVYVGAASGQHITFLAQLFLNVKFHLYDSQQFAKSLRDYAKQSINEQVTIFDRLFTLNDAIEYGTNGKGQQILFISDIRDANIDNNHPELEDREDYISSEMQMQREWAEQIQPRMAMFKFRLRFNKQPHDFTEYFRGHVFYQPWTKHESAELRLITDCRELRLYNDYDYERIMCYHNRIRRNELQEGIQDNSLWPYFDVKMEYDIWKLYLLKIRSLSYLRSDFVIQFMFKTSNRLTCYKDRMNKHYRNVFLKEHYKVKEYKEPDQQQEDDDEWITYQPRRKSKKRL